MAATELRKGNIHKGKEYSIPREGIKSVLVGGEAFSIITPYGIYLVDEGEMDFEPIMLTEEWILKFGFEKLEEHYELEGFKIWWSDNSGHKSFYHINSETLTHFDTVHHLQNYYFFLNLLSGQGGDELTIT